MSRAPIPDPKADLRSPTSRRGKGKGESLRRMRKKLEQIEAPNDLLK